MKKAIAAGVLMLVMSGAFAQDAISKFFSKYQSDESFNQVTVSSKMFALFTNMEAETAEDKEVLEAISKLKGLRILAKDDARNARALYKEAFTLIPVKEYEELMSVRNQGQGHEISHQGKRRKNFRTTDDHGRQRTIYGDEPLRRN